MIITDVPSAEMIKYASNAFLATKISFINAIANICEAAGADVTQVMKGMGLDPRIGAAVPAGGPRLRRLLLPQGHRLARSTPRRELGYDFKLLRAVVEINTRAGHALRRT